MNKIDLHSMVPQVVKPRVKLGERIARQLVDLVASGSLLPGDRLPPEAELVQLLAVSRASVREGLRLLEATGVVEIHAGRDGGAFISDVGAEAFATTSTLYVQLVGGTYGDLLEARLMIEPGLAGHAAARRDEGDLVRLRAHLDAVRSFDLDAPTLRAHSSVRFHVDLLRASGNRALALYVGAMTSVWAERYAALIEADGSTEPARENEAGLAEILRAVESADETAASEAMRTALLGMRSRVEVNYPDLIGETILWGGPRP